MVTVKNIYDYIDTIAPFETAMDFDNVGILAGNSAAQVNKTLLSLDITPPVINEAEKLGAELIISHHPIIFTPLKSLDYGSVPYLLAKSGITAICAHTNLDLAQCGVNTCLAKALKLNSINLISGDAIAVGILSMPLTPTEFAHKVKTDLRCNGLRYTKGSKKITTVAVSSGAGGDNVFKALSLGADALVTGEIKHNYILSAVEHGLTIVDAGHYKTEDVVIQPLADMLKENFSGVQFIKSSLFTDSVEYL